MNTSTENTKEIDENIELLNRAIDKYGIKHGAYSKPIGRVRLDTEYLRKEYGNGKLVIISGYFNPLHQGHIDYIKNAQKLGDYLLVIINNDEQVNLKGSIPFQSASERYNIIDTLYPVSFVKIAMDTDKTVCKTLETIKTDYPDFEEYIFANGGDRKEAMYQKKKCVID